MEMKLDSCYFNSIINKEKLYEIRIYDKKRQKIKLLDKVKFINKENETNSFYAYITELSYFDNFRNALVELDIKKVLPDVKNIDECIDIYNNFPHSEGGFYKDAVEKYGVLRMKFKIF